MKTDLSAKLGHGILFWDPPATCTRVNTYTVHVAYMCINNMHVLIHISCMLRICVLTTCTCMQHASVNTYTVHAAYICINNMHVHATCKC